MTSPRSYKHSLFHSAIALAIIAVLVTFTFVVGKDIGARATHMREIRDEGKFRSEAIQSFVSLRNEYTKAQSYFSVLENILPPQDKLLNFPKDIKELGKKRGLDVSVSFSFSDGVAGTATQPGYVNFQMSVQGPFSGFVAFLDDLKRGTYTIALSSMEFVWGEKNISSTMLGKVFSR